MFSKRYLSNLLFFPGLNVQNVCQSCVGNSRSKSNISSISDNVTFGEPELKREKIKSSGKNFSNDTEKHEKFIKDASSNYTNLVQPLKNIISESIKIDALNKKNEFTSVNESNTDITKRGALLKKNATNRFKEEKLMFGKLLETRKKKLALEGGAKIAMPQDARTDTELSWILKSSGTNLKRISVRKKPKPLKSKECSQQERKSYSEKQESSLNDKDNQVNEQNALLKDLCLSENKEIGDEDVKSNTSSLNSLLLPQIVIKNITSFSIFDTAKSENNINESEVTTNITRIDTPFQHFPSVTNILRETMSPEAKMRLEMWKESMIKKLGQEGFDKYSKELLEDGKMLHSCIENTLLQKEFETPPRVQPAFSSLDTVLPEIYDLNVIETYTQHPKLRYKGVVDCVASYRGEKYVIDWKKSDKRKKTLEATFDAPIQVAAYIGAINASNAHSFTLDRGLIVIAYTSGEPATIHELKDDDLQKYWRIWLSRLQRYHEQIAPNTN